MVIVFTLTNTDLKSLRAAGKKLVWKVKDVESAAGKKIILSCKQQKAYNGKGQFSLKIARKLANEKD